MKFSNHYSQRLRSLAQQQMEIAQSPKMSKIVNDWRAHGSFSKSSRPMVSIELWTFAHDVLEPLMACQEPEARNLEWQLLSNIVNHTLFDDDTVVNPYMGFYYKSQFIPFGLPAQIEHISGDNQSLGHHFVEQLTDLESSFEKLGKSGMTLGPKEETLRQMEEWDSLFGDFLPAKLVSPSLVCCPTQDVVHLMSMENMFYAMYDSPELFHKMLDMLTDNYLEFFGMLQNDDRLGATTEEQRVCQGTYCFTDALPANKAHYDTTDIWGYMDSQETSGLSPAMYEEFIFPYYQKIMKHMGRVSYGCCEAVDPIWDNCISKIPNLGKVSISPWCNEEFMGERLSGKKTVYLRKPSPNLIGITKELDEDEVRRHFERTVQAAQGCWLEIVQRDVYRIYDTPDKVRRYVALIRQACEKHQK